MVEEASAPYFNWL